MAEEGWWSRVDWGTAGELGEVGEGGCSGWRRAGRRGGGMGVAGEGTGVRVLSRRVEEAINQRLFYYPGGGVCRGEMGLLTLFV